MFQLFLPWSRNISQQIFYSNSGYPTLKQMTFEKFRAPLKNEKELIIESWNISFICFFRQLGQLGQHRFQCQLGQDHSRYLLDRSQPLPRHAPRRPQKEGQIPFCLKNPDENFAWQTEIRSWGIDRRKIYYFGLVRNSRTMYLGQGCGWRSKCLKKYKAKFNLHHTTLPKHQDLFLVL